VEVVEVGVFRRGWVTLSTNFTVDVRKLEWLLFHVVSKYPQWIVWFCHKARIRQTDRITTPKTALA